MEITAILIQGSGSKSYMVHATPEGRLTCSCPDQFYRAQDNPDHRCKHIRFAADAIRLEKVPG